MKVRINVSLEDSLIKKAKRKAADMGFNFSSYVTYLINRDLSGETAADTTTHTSQLNESQKNALDQFDL